MTLGHLIYQFIFYSSMRELLTSVCLFILGCFCVHEVSAAETPFEIECNFDVDADFSDGANLPEGWAQDGTALRRMTGTDFGYGSNSGDYILGCGSPQFDEILYTPVKSLVAGKPCTLEFYYIAPGGTPDIVRNVHLIVKAGTAQNKDAQTVLLKETPTVATKEWTKHSYTFTPDTDGDYCFSIELAPYMPSFNTACGSVGFDSFIISGTAKESAPDTDALFYDFEDDALFPGISLIPTGWASTGQKPFLRKTVEDLSIPVAAPSGQWVLGNIGSGTQQNHLLISPVFDAKAGQPATMQFHFYAPTDNMMFGYGFNVYVAPTQDTPIAEAKKIATIEEDINRPKEWMTTDVFSYVPEEDEQMCFIITAFNAYGYAPGGSVAFDDFTFTGVKIHEDGGDTPGPDDPTPGKKTEEFEFECNFDIDADFPDGANLAAGWAQDGTPLRRASGDDYGFTNQSGDYILAGSVKFDEVLYTPMMDLVAGKPCTLEFYYIAPGGASAPAVYNAHLIVRAGTAQNIDAQTFKIKEESTVPTTDWTKFSYTFIPETDGEYCFSIELAPYSDAFRRNCGSVGFDSFIISGTRYAEETGPDIDSLEPNEDNLQDCIDLPYLENFSDMSHYTGESNLPKGWATTGSVTWVTATAPGLEPHSGDYYMVTNHNTSGERDDKAYTPFFNLEAGTEYTVSYWLFMQGNDWNDDEILYLPELAFTVGTEQEADFHVTLDRFSEKTTAWVKRSHTFTPKISGPYCFAFMLTGPENSGWVMVDDLEITAPGLIARVEPGFMPKGIYSPMTSSTICFEGTPMQMINTSKYADSYQWTAEGAEPSESTEENPFFTFPADGTYTITLSATNERGTRTTQRKVTVEQVGPGTQDDQVLHLYSSANDRLYDRAAVPTLDSDPDYDFITGFNHYYFDIAQRFDFSETVPVKIKQMSVRVTDRRYRAMTSYFDDQRIKPMSIVIYGSKEDGTLDEDNVIGQLDTTIGDALGSSGLGGNTSDPRDIAFPAPIEVSGTFYVAMKFDRGMEVIPQDASLGRSYIATAAIRHGHGQTSLYVKPVDKPAISSAEIGKWCPVDAIDARQKGMGAYWMLWVSAYDENSGVVAVGPDGQADFAATFIADDLCVTGCEEGETLALYTMGGVQVASAVTSAGSQTVSLPHLPAGVYVVKCGDKAVKVIRQ